MKKYRMVNAKKAACAAIAACTVICTGCGNAATEGESTVAMQSTQAQTAQQKTTEAPTQVTTAKAIKSPMSQIGIYIPVEGTGSRKLLDKYQSTWVKGQDIICFEVFNSNDATITGDYFKYAFEAMWFAETDSTTAKIGYTITLNLKDGTKVKSTIKEPKDTLPLFDYIEVYLYDDYHQTKGVWYSHVEQSAYNKDTILTSAKLTAGSKVAQVSDIVFEAFTYNSEDEFNADGDYIGSNHYSIPVTNN